MTGQVYVLYVGLLLGALNRLPIKLPRRGAGRRHTSGIPAQAITFDDVAGVDEAKEELSEIVVRSPYCLASNPISSVCKGRWVLLVLMSLGRCG